MVFAKWVTTAVKFAERQNALNLYAKLGDPLQTEKDKFDEMKGQYEALT